jgi:hypothetical protein
MPELFHCPFCGSRLYQGRKPHKPRTEEQRAKSRVANLEFYRKHRHEPDYQTKIRERARAQLQKNRRNLADAYIKKLLTKGTLLRASDIPAPLVEAKREHIKLYRAARESKRSKR